MELRHQPSQFELSGAPRTPTSSGVPPVTSALGRECPETAHATLPPKRSQVSKPRELLLVSAGARPVCPAPSYPAAHRDFVISPPSQAELDAFGERESMPVGLLTLARSFDDPVRYRQRRRRYCLKGQSAAVIPSPLGRGELSRKNLASCWNFNLPAVSRGCSSRRWP